MTKSKRGGQRDTATETMVKVVLEDVLKKANNIQPKLIEEICIGNVLQPGSANSLGSMGQLMAGIPHDTPYFAINRMCSSGL